METTLQLKEINLFRGIGCKHPDISEKKKYIVDYGGHQILGHFKKEGYGWNFCWFGMHYTGLQLDSLDKVFEIIF